MRLPLKTELLNAISASRRFWRVTGAGGIYGYTARSGEQLHPSSQLHGLRDPVDGYDVGAAPQADLVFGRCVPHRVE